MFAVSSHPVHMSLSVRMQCVDHYSNPTMVHWFVKRSYKHFTLDVHDCQDMVLLDHLKPAYLYVCSSQDDLPTLCVCILIVCLCHVSKRK